MSKYLGPLTKSTEKLRSYDVRVKDIMNIFSGPALSEYKGGFICFYVISDEVMAVRLMVSPTMLANPPTTTEIIKRDSKPPVRVLYWV